MYVRVHACVCSIRARTDACTHVPMPRQTNWTRGMHTNHMWTCNYLTQCVCNLGALSRTSRPGKCDYYEGWTREEHTSYFPKELFIDSKKVWYGQIVGVTHTAQWKLCTLLGIWTANFTPHDLTLVYLCLYCSSGFRVCEEKPKFSWFVPHCWGWVDCWSSDNRDNAHNFPTPG